MTAVSHRDVVVILPDIRSTHNTGSFFRTADGAGVSKIILTGITAPPPHPHLLKVSLGAEQAVQWEYCKSTINAIKRLRIAGYAIVAVEQTPASKPYNAVLYPQRVAVIFGNEVVGISQEVLQLADVVVDVPMRGTKESLNVSVVGGIVLYYLLG